MPVKASASREEFWCSAGGRMPGQFGRWYRTEDGRPSARLAVSSTSATRPVARVRYQNGVEELTTIAVGGTGAARTAVASTHLAPSLVLAPARAVPPPAHPPHAPLLPH